MDRNLRFERKSRGFESLRAYRKVSVRPRNSVGSECPRPKGEADGSSPSVATAVLKYIYYLSSGKRGIVEHPHSESTPVEKLQADRKPFYTPIEVAKITGLDETQILERMQLPEADSNYLYALELEQGAWRIPLGAVVQLIGVPAAIKRGTAPRRVNED